MKNRISSSHHVRTFALVNKFCQWQTTMTMLCQGS